MNKIYLKTRFNNILTGILVFLNLTLINFIGFDKVIHSISLLGIFVPVTILIFGIALMHYEFRIREDGVIHYNLVFLGFKKVIQEFSKTNIHKLEIKQLDNKYYGIYLFLNSNNPEILLDSKATLDKAKERIEDLRNDFSHSNMSV